MLIQNQPYDYCYKILPTIFIGPRILADEVACTIKQKFIELNALVAHTSCPAADNNSQLNQVILVSQS